MNNAVAEADELVEKKARNTVKIIFCLLFVMINLIMVVKGITSGSSVQVDDAATVSYTSMQSGNCYYFSEAVICDQYAETRVVSFSYEDSYIVYFADKDGKRIYTDFTVERDSELGQKLKAYVEDDSLYVGDFVASGCFVGRVQSDSEALGYFEKAYELYNMLLPGECLSWEFEYTDTETVEEYQAKEAKNGVEISEFGVFGMILGIVAISIHLRKRKKFFPEGYVFRLQKYAVQCLPEDLNNLLVYREMLAMLKIVFPLTDDNFPFAKKIFETETLGNMTMQQFHERLALSVETWCGCFKEREIMKTVDGLFPQQLLKTFIALTFFAVVLDVEQRSNISTYQWQIAGTLYRHGFEIPEEG